MVKILSIVAALKSHFIVAWVSEKLGVEPETALIFVVAFVAIGITAFFIRRRMKKAE